MSLEMKDEVYMLRLLSLLSGISQRQLRQRVTLGMEEHEALAKAERQLAQSNLRIYDNIYSLKGIRSTARRMKETVGLDVLIVDFLQNVSVDGKDEWASARETALECQRIAKDLDCTVVAFSQVSNEQAKRADAGESGSYYSFKGHGGIRDAADVGIMLWRDLKANSPVLHVEVVKNRHDEKGKVYADMDLPTGRIKEIDDPDGDVV
jgi:replicative DNA helicase